MVPEVGKTYKINHVRKGEFSGKVLKVRGVWADVELVAGKASYVASVDARSGDVVGVRLSFCEFTEINPDG